MKTVTHLDLGLYCFDSDAPKWPSENLLEFAAWLQSQIAGIPEESRGSARIVLGSQEDSPTLEIEYVRPYTPEELAKCEADLLAQAEWIKQHELKQLAQLKAKYPQA